jgi:hypothetical protein
MPTACQHFQHGITLFGAVAVACRIVIITQRPLTQGRTYLDITESPCFAGFAAIIELEQLQAIAHGNASATAGSRGCM